MSDERDPLTQWKRSMATVDPAVILLTGARVWPESVNPDHSAHAPHATWIGTDIEAGDGVELVADLQTVHTATDQRFEGVFSPATLEHIERPWTAFYSIGQILKPGGLLFLHTHQTFPLHGYPHDYFRFSRSALETMCRDAGLEVVCSGYDSPCTITPPPSVTVWNIVAESYLNVCICARKP